jgi:hypothetical protein
MKGRNVFKIVKDKPTRRPRRRWEKNTSLK